MFPLFMTNVADDGADLIHASFRTDTIQLLHDQARLLAPGCPVRTANRARGQFESNSLNSGHCHFPVAVEVHFTHIPTILLAVMLAKLVKKNRAYFYLLSS